jgi:phospholipase/carboxylesterase
MQSGDKEYGAALRPIEEKLLAFLRFFEKLQEEISFNNVSEVQGKLQDATADLFPPMTADLAALTPQEGQADFHAKFSDAVTRLQDATTKVLSGKGRQFAEAFLAARQDYCQGLSLLYEIRAQLPGLQAYWVLPEALPELAALDTRIARAEVPVGFSHKGRTDAHAAYSLYVPENYSPQRSWPLIVCLHGGYGRGDEYIWTWLRPAKSKGYLLLSPKSIGPTWSVLNPPLDIRSIRAMLDEVCAAYAVDRKRVYLSGLSDGGMFAYLLGLSCPDWFAGIAPVAGELSPMTDPMLRQKQGKDVPLFVIHGAKDFIFDVRSVRSSCDLLQKIGYNVTYKELPDWGHAYTYSINEQLVLPWFESLGGAGQPA